MKYRNGYSSHWERQFTCPRSLSYWRKWALHEERYILHVSYLKKKKNSFSCHWSTADYEARTIPVTLPYMVWRVWLTEILETFQQVFRFEKSRIKENGGNVSGFLWVSKCYNLQKNDVSLEQSRNNLKWQTWLESESCPQTSSFVSFSSDQHFSAFSSFHWTSLFATFTCRKRMFDTFLFLSVVIRCSNSKKKCDETRVLSFSFLARSSEGPAT